MRPRTLFLAGLVLGAFLGLAFLLAPVTLLPALFVWPWVIGHRPRFVGGSGGLIGFGVLWFILIGQSAWRCANDPTCSQPDVGPWLAFGAGVVVVGVALGLYSARRLRADPLTQPSARSAVSPVKRSQRARATST